LDEDGADGFRSRRRRRRLQQQQQQDGEDDDVVDRRVAAEDVRSVWISFADRLFHCSL
jgi:ribosomal protein L20